MAYVVVYRTGSGRGAPARRYTAAVGKVTPEAARGRWVAYARPVRSLRLTSHALSDGRWLMIAGAILVVLGLSVLHSAQRHKTLGGTMIAFAHHRQLEPIDELRAQCLSRAHVRGRLAVPPWGRRFYTARCQAAVRILNYYRRLGLFARFFSVPRRGRRSSPFTMSFAVPPSSFESRSASSFSTAINSSKPILLPVLG
jgi:hypothetical protein